MFTPEQLKSLSATELEQNFEFNIPSGDDADSLWQDMVNLRPQVDGRYVFSKFRGGSQLRFAISGQTITQTETVTLDIGDGSKEYYISLAQSGNVYLQENGVGSPVLIMSGFDGEKAVRFLSNGRFLYGFEHGGAVKKYYDFIINQSFDFNGADVSNITGVSFIGSTFDQESVFGFEKGNTAIIIPTKNRSMTDFISGNAVNFSPFIARLDEVNEDNIKYTNKDLFGSAQVVSSNSDSILPYNGDMENVISFEGPYKIYTFDIGFNIDEGNDPIITTIGINDEYRLITVHRAYVIVDILNDGSVRISGRPVVASINEETILNNRRNAVQLTVSTSPAGVAKRFLCATRWQYNTERAFNPSNERNINSGFFIVSELNTEAHDYIDRTPDRKLIRPIAEISPYRAGVSLLFHPEGIQFNTATSFKGSLLTGNYKINRPVPLPYTSNVGQGNCFMDIKAGDPIGSSLSYVFEYTDRFKSDIVDSGVGLTNATNQVIDKRDTKAIASDFMTFFDLGTKAANSITYKILVSKSPFTNKESLNFTINKGDTTEQAIDKIISAVLQSNIMDTWDIIKTEFFGTASYRFESKGVGSTWNNYAFNFVEVSRVDPDDEEFPGYGGFGLTSMLAKNSTFKSTPANRLQIHSLNALVSKVYVLTKTGATYRVLKEFSSQDAGFHGDPVVLPISGIDDLPAFASIDASQIKTSVSLSSGITLSIPFQEMRIDRQYRAHSDYPIQRIFPLRFDSDKAAQLRFQISVVTDSDTQIGYLSGQGDTFDAQFEPVDDSVEILNPQYATKVSDIIFLQTQEGINRFSQDGLQLVVPRDRYPFLSNSFTGATYNTRHGEYWLCFGGQDILVINNGRFYTMNYPVNVFDVKYSFNRMVICSATGIYTTDDETLYRDNIGSLQNIQAELVSRHLSNELTQIRLFDFEIVGKLADVTLFLDSQIERYESENPDVWEKVFDVDYSYALQNLKMNGTRWQINERAIMPRFKVTAIPKDVSAFISKAMLKAYITDNKNVARL